VTSLQRVSTEYGNGALKLLTFRLLTCGVANLLYGDRERELNPRRLNSDLDRIM